MAEQQGLPIYVGKEKHSYHNVEFIREMKTTPTGRVRVYVLETVTHEEMFAGPNESRRTVVPGDSKSTRIMRRTDDGLLVCGSGSGEQFFEIWDGKPVVESCYY